MPAFGELEGIAGQVEQALAQTHHVTAQPGGHGIGIDTDVETLGIGRIGQQRTHMVQHRRQCKITLLQLHLAGFYLRDIEDVVDDRQQMLARRIDFVQALFLQRRRLGTQQIGQPENGVERGADFVRHIGQKAAFGLIGRFSTGFGFGKLRRARIDQFIEMITMAQQFGGIELLLVQQRRQLARHRVDPQLQLAQFIIRNDRNPRRQRPLLDRLQHLKRKLHPARNQALGDEHDGGGTEQDEQQGSTDSPERDDPLLGIRLRRADRRHQGIGRRPAPFILGRQPQYGRQGVRTDKKPDRRQAAAEPGRIDHRYAAGLLPQVPRIGRHNDPPVPPDRQAR